MKIQKLHQSRTQKKKRNVTVNNRSNLTNKNRNFQESFKSSITPFWERDISSIINKDETVNTNNKNICRAYIGINDFISSFFEDMQILYPKIMEEKEYVIRLLTRIINEK